MCWMSRNTAGALEVTVCWMSRNTAGAVEEAVSAYIKALSILSAKPKPTAARSMIVGVAGVETGPRVRGDEPWRAASRAAAAGGGRGGVRGGSSSSGSRFHGFSFFNLSR